jgi:hypothetical protein
MRHGYEGNTSSPDTITGRLDRRQLADATYSEPIRQYHPHRYGKRNPNDRGGERVNPS